MKQKGFTLIELLAIVIILAIIAVITIPLISKTINDSKRNAAKDSSYGYKNAVHQFYLTELASDNDFDFDGEYDISNGSISDGFNTYNILTSGSAPESGNVVISNGEIVSGCINYGDYSVFYENGDVTDTIAGRCYDITYFTYDGEASNGSFGNITSMSSSLDSSWNYYVKEMEYPNKFKYSIFEKSSDYYETNVSTLSLEKCEEAHDLFDEEDYDLYECNILENYKTYQVCGVLDGNTFCLKPGINNVNYNIHILDSVFDDCEDELSYGYICTNLDNTLLAGVSPSGRVIVTDFYGQCTSYISDIDFFEEVIDVSCSDYDSTRK